MVDSIRQAFINNLENVKWMDNQTNQAAKEKVRRGHKGRLINNVIRELKHRRFRDANGSRKLNVLFPGACYKFLNCSIYFKMLERGLSS